MRLMKQFLYGGGLFLIIALICTGVYFMFFASDPTCFDDSKNQGETAVDCGGPCISCGIKNVKDIQVYSKNIFNASDGVGVAIGLQNPNIEFGAEDFSYKIVLKSISGETINVLAENSFIYAGEMKYIIKPYINYNMAQVSNIDIQISNPKWVEMDSFKKPRFSISDTRTIKNDSDGYIRVTGKIENKDAVTYTPVNVMALLYSHEGGMVSASRIKIDSMNKFDSTGFSVPFPKDLNIYQDVFSASDDFPKNLVSGDSGNEVSILQAFLAEIGILNRDTTGFYDDATTIAVKMAQAQFGIEVTGDFDEPTRQFVINMISSNTNNTLDEENEKSIDTTKTVIYAEAKK